MHDRRDDATHVGNDWRLTHGLRYGALGAPLAFAALPLYVHWPAFAERATGLSLAMLGALLIVMRCADAVIDPWLGRGVDHLLTRPVAAAMPLLVLGAMVLAAGFGALFVAPSMVTLSRGAWVAVSAMALGLTYLGYSLLQIAHQAWGARLGGDAAYRARVVGAREVFALAGVLAASVLPSVWGWGAITSLLAALLVLGLALLAGAPMDRRASQTVRLTTGRPPSMFNPLRHAEFRALLLVHLLNGLASAIPATLVLFFIRDRLVLPQYEALFLFLYFVAGAASVPLWTRLVARLGLVRVWASGMVLAILVFAFAAWLSAGAALGFALVCIGSGVALGAELVVPTAMLAGAVARSGQAQQAEGLWFGWWNLCSKLNLALAAGVALPLVAWLGFRSGQRDEASVAALVWVYALVPCVIKAFALIALLRGRWGEGRSGGTLVGEGGA